jgi:hypothetical protein
MNARLARAFILGGDADPGRGLPWVPSYVCS